MRIVLWSDLRTLLYSEKHCSGLKGRTVIHPTVSSPTSMSIRMSLNVLEVIAKARKFL